MAELESGTSLNPEVAFLIGLSIVLLASILNAAGLNLTKLDHVRTRAVPKSERSSDWKRPLWVIGMLLYILSQLLGSTLALEYMRAEYVAPLGASSLVFNFLFARFLVGTPVTRSDIHGTVVVILGVFGIVVFGSINSGLASDTDVAHLSHLWQRPGWLGFFFCMSSALLTLLVIINHLDAVFAARGDIDCIPPPAVSIGGFFTDGVFCRKYRISDQARMAIGKIVLIKARCTTLLTQWLDKWASEHQDSHVAWILGIGWSCCGGGLAGACLVFAKATVKLLTGFISKQSTDNPFHHAAPIFTMVLLGATAILQIMCLNRGLRIYDSTLVVPVFYGVYTATGFLDSLIFNDAVDAYETWTLFLIFASILLLITGVVLLTHKKTEPVGKSIGPVIRRGGETEEVLWVDSELDEDTNIDEEEGSYRTVGKRNIEGRTQGKVRRDEERRELMGTIDEEPEELDGDKIKR